jgi:hypothetical protein
MFNRLYDIEKEKEKEIFYQNFKVNKYTKIKI